MKTIPVRLGFDPFAGPDTVVAIAEIHEDKIVIKVELDRLVQVTGNVPHLKANPLTSTEQVVGLGLNVAYTPKP